MERKFSNLTVSGNGPDRELPSFKGDTLDFIKIRMKQNEILAKGKYSIAQLLEKDLRDDKFMDMIRFFVSHTMQDPDNKKSDEEALKLKESGNRQYKSGNLKEALENYNDSIVFGTSSSLAVGYSNRSEVLFQMEEFNKCLTDIERSLSYECKDLVKLKLFIRRTKCFLKLKRIDDAVKSVESVESWLENADLMEGMKTETKKELSKLRDEIPGSDSEVSIQVHSNWEPKLSYGPNAKSPPLTAAVDVKFSEEKGRYAVANRPLRVGDVVLIEKPYVCAVDMTFKTKLPKDHRCNNCIGSTLMSVVPCPHCSQVRYCSESCRDESWRKFHYMECGCTAFCTSVLALRILLAAGVENVIAMKEQLNERQDNQLPGFNKNGEFEHEKYYSVYHLTRLKEDAELEFKATVVNVCVHTLMYLELMYQSKIDNLEMDDQLRQSRKKNLESQGPNASCFTWEERIFLANILARHLLTSRYHCTDIRRNCLVPSDASRPLGLVATNLVGSAIHPVLNSFFNHSCDPNLAVCSVASTIILSVIRDVDEGEELCFSYGPKCFQKPRDERQADLLNRYNFVCKCSACEDAKGTQNIAFLDLQKDTRSSFSHVLRGASKDLVARTFTLTCKFSAAVSKLRKNVNFPVALMLYDQCLTHVESEQEISDFKLSTLFWELHQVMLACMTEKVALEINDDSSSEETFRDFDGAVEITTKPPNFVLLLDVVEHCLTSLPDLQSTQGLECEFVADYKMEYCMLLVQMDALRRGHLRHNKRWRALAKEGLEFLTVLKKCKPKGWRCDVDAFMSILNDLSYSLNNCLKG